jgi:hypothetical protein
MTSLQIAYTEFTIAGLVSIFQLADLLNVTPKRACEIYLLEKAKTSTQPAN